LESYREKEYPFRCLLDVSDTELALIGKRVENEFIGVNSGIMDQFAVQKGKTILYPLKAAGIISCSSLSQFNRMAMFFLPFCTAAWMFPILNWRLSEKESKMNLSA
jgi:hypothetical protein